MKHKSHTEPRKEQIPQKRGKMCYYVDSEELTQNNNWSAGYRAISLGWSKITGHGGKRSMKEAAGEYLICSTIQIGILISGRKI
jgi:hypothetical protein